MDATQLTAGLICLATWLGFASTMKSYFRYSRQRTPAKTRLIVCGYICTGVQLLTLFLSKTPGLLFFGLGIAGFAVANGLFWWSLAAHGKTHPAFAFIRVAPTTLTTAGPYRFLRHPIYSAYLLAWSAGVVLSGQPWLLATVVCMAIFYTIAARREEQSFLASEFAPSYQAYRSRTGMFLPKIMALFIGVPSQPSS